MDDGNPDAEPSARPKPASDRFCRVIPKRSEGLSPMSAANIDSALIPKADSDKARCYYTA